MTTKYITALLLAPVLLLQLSCKKWLDVKPKSQIEADVLYQRESGFKDVLYGAYINMAGTSMYGREMTFGLVDVIGNTYAHTGSNYALAQTYQYDNTSVEPLITAAWQSTYNTIANLNSLIANLRTADKTMFGKDNYNVILGEALGLRAFLHFDLLRLFAPSYKANPSATAIPYVTQYGSAITPDGTVTTVLTGITADMEEAAALLKVADPIVTNRAITANIDDGYLLQRNFHFNYYAAKATLARIYMYKADYVNAAKCADEVIDAGKFNWIQVDAVAVADDAKRDRTFTPEQVFVLNTPKMSDNIIDRLQYTAFGTAGGLSLYFLTADINRLYPDANDWRKLYAWSLERSGVSSERFNTKLWQPEGMPVALNSRMPLIRLPELYLISAEAALASDPSKTISRIRTLRIHRGMDAGIPDGTAADVLSTEIMKEYHREFICEGQLFYYYKRLDMATMDGVTTPFDKAKYVLPKPAEEIEFR